MESKLGLCRLVGAKKRFCCLIIRAVIFIGNPPVIDVGNRTAGESWLTARSQVSVFPTNREQVIY